MKTVVRRLKYDTHPWAVLCVCQMDPIGQATDWRVAMDYAIWHAAFCPYVRKESK